MNKENEINHEILLTESKENWLSELNSWIITNRDDTVFINMLWDIKSKILRCKKANDYIPIIINIEKECHDICMIYVIDRRSQSEQYHSLVELLEILNRVKNQIMAKNLITEEQLSPYRDKKKIDLRCVDEDSSIFDELDSLIKKFI